MSQPSVVDSGDAGPEENPEPEEDSDWCQSVQAGIAEASDLISGAQDEDPEAISSEIGAVAASDASSNTRDQVESENEQISQQKQATDEPIQLEIQHNEDDNVCCPAAPEEDSREPSASSCLVEGDSFEQDEKLAAPESENAVILQTSSESESDQQLLGAQFSAMRSEDNCPCDESVMRAPSELEYNDGPSNVAPQNTLNDKLEECADGLGDDNAHSHNFSGDVSVDNCTGVDAPEDDYRMNISPVEVTTENDQVSASVESSAIESQRLNDILLEGDRDSQVPECDRAEEVVSQSTENNFQMSSSVAESLLSNANTPKENVPESEANQNSHLTGAINVRGDEHSHNISSENVYLSQTDNTDFHSSGDQINCDSKCEASNVECEHENSSSVSSPSHVRDQLEHSNDSSPQHHSLSNQTDNITHTASTVPSASAPEGSRINTPQCVTSPSSSPNLSPLKTDIIASNTTSTDPLSFTTDGSLQSLKDMANTAATTISNTDTVNVRTCQTLTNNSPKSNAISLTQSHKVTTTSDESSASASYFSPRRERILDVSPDDIQKQLSLALAKDDEDDLDDIISELNAELLSSGLSPQRSVLRQQPPGQSHSFHTSSKNSRGEKSRSVNGTVDAEFKQVQDHNRQLLEQLMIRDVEIKKLNEERESMRADLARAQSEQDKVLSKSSTSNHSADDLYLPQIKELENTIVQQQKDLRATKDKLISHDTAAKRAVTTLQNELKSRVDQVTKLYEDAVKEKDSMVVMFASSESRVMEMKRAMEKLEHRLREGIKEKEGLLVTLKAAKTDKQRAVNGLEQKCHELSNVQKEMEKLKEALSSGDYRIKWFQNKLKEELEAHKETKTNLEKTTSKLKETKEETEIIRKECQAIVKTYQESEEIKSNSLDKELKIKESQLKLQMQECSDTEEIHQRTRRELESLRDQHKEVVSQVSVLKEKVQGLETTVAEKENAISQSNELLNKQKTDISGMTSKLKAKQNLDEDFIRAQEMITTLDRDISELKISNRDLQKDMDSCRERESKMLALQSELSRTNACLRSENTTLSNKATNQTAEVQKLKMEIQEFETTVKHLTDSVEEEKKNYAQATVKLKASLEEKTRESSDFEQKWEDEIDSNKTLKRRHANNIKDLTRQLQQTKRRLEVMEGSRKDSGGSMGSRTNSNGSLNSMADGGQPGNQHAPSGLAATSSAPAQEFPVITEQVEINKQVLIERIVRLQKSHARKNEKLEFLGEHIQQLLEEIKKKTKIIQSYVMREEAGTLSSEDMDANKSLLSRKGGIMASVYSLHQQDGNMTLELSLQINKKLQAVLEDTLLKNITLKENLDTLGEEIARLSQVNRKLQLHLQDLENTKRN